MKTKSNKKVEDVELLFSAPSPERRQDIQEAGLVDDWKAIPMITMIVSS